MENDQTIRGRFSVRNLLTAVIGSLAPTLTVCIFTPLDVVLNNQKEFALPFSELAGLMILPAVLIFAGLFLLQMLALVLHEKAFRVVSGLLLGLSLSFAAQQLFMNGSMTDAANGSFVGDISSAKRIINSVIHAELILIPPLAVLSRKKKQQTEAPGFFQRNLFAVIFCGIMLMQGSGFLTSYLQNNPAKQSTAEDGNGSTEQMFALSPLVSFSRENNIMVFLVDRFDSHFGDALLETYPELKTELDGFTFYQNNLSASVRTFPSVASMLTHQPYDNSDDYLKKAWSHENMLSVLRENGYTVNLVPDVINTGGEISTFEPFCDNLETLHGTGKTILKDTARKMLFGLGAARILPYALKNECNFAAGLLTDVQYLSYAFEGMEAYSAGRISCRSDAAFYDFVQSAQFSAENEKKSFSFIHLNGTHDENPELVEKTGISGNTENITVTRANFETILCFLHNAKTLGVYDETTFIILGDHGAVPDDRFTEELTAPVVAALMVKPAHAEHGALQYDRMSALSNDMFSASVLEYAGLDHAAYGASFNDIIQSGEVPERRLKNIYERRNETADTVITEYAVNGDARDFANWKRISRTEQ